MTPPPKDQTAATSAETTRQGIGSLEIGLRILNAIAAAPRPMTLKNLSTELGLSSSRLHKYLVSLLRSDFITQLNGSGYTLGTGALTLGIAAIRGIDPIQRTLDAVDRLNQVADRTVSVTIWNGNAPLVIKWLDASRPIAVNVRLGTELSPFFSASGRVFLAHLPQQRRDAIVDAFYRNPPALPRNRGAVLGRDAFIEHLEQVKEENLCAFYGDFLPDINVLASAVFDINGRIPAVISLMGLNGDTDITTGGRLQRLVSASARSVTKQICGTTTA